MWVQVPTPYRISSEAFPPSPLRAGAKAQHVIGRLGLDRTIKAALPRPVRPSGAPPEAPPAQRPARGREDPPRPSTTCRPRSAIAPPNSPRRPAARARCRRCPAQAPTTATCHQPRRDTASVRAPRGPGFPRRRSARRRLRRRRQTAAGSRRRPSARAPTRCQVHLAPVLSFHGVRAARANHRRFRGRAPTIPTGRRRRRLRALPSGDQGSRAARLHRGRARIALWGRAATRPSSTPPPTAAPPSR
mmetsp:Transcript_16968/g.45313  ORF Transcript_16968/g.45313 Transcript_16968/m.45313 type:complete len:246 (-) Transcript_16968:90-827(-)